MFRLHKIGDAVEMMEESLEKQKEMLYVVSRGNRRLTIVRIFAYETTGE